MKSNFKAPGKNAIKSKVHHAEPSQYLFYEAAVQSPEWQVHYLPVFHREALGTEAYSLREDFCGSGSIACEWARRSKKHKAVGIDLDPEPIEYAIGVNRHALKPDEQKRARFLCQNVLKVTTEKFDMIGAYNFSFYTFHERRTLLRYAKAAFQSLRTRGTFFLEMMGGDGFMESLQEERVIEIPSVSVGKMIWEQHQYDPITAVSDFSIHFRLPRGDWMNDVFRYHWRLWGIRDVREILVEAGFKDTYVLWGELNENGEETREFLLQENADYQKAWIAYVVGVKK